MNQMQFLSVATIKTLSKRIASYGMVASPIECCYGYDIQIDFPTVFEGPVRLRTDPFCVRLNGSCFATLVAGAMRVKQECEDRADPMIDDGELERDTNRRISDAAGFLLETLIKVLDEVAA